MGRWNCLWVCVLAWGVGGGHVNAQLLTEEIQLQSGWNAVWVNLDPEPNDLEQVLAQQTPTLDFQSIWTFDANRAISTSTPGRWLFFDADVPAALSTLHSMPGQRAYFIKMRSAGRLRLTGRPLIRAARFTSLVSNPFGAPTNPQGGPLTFEEFFAHPGAAGKILASGTPPRHEIFTLVGDALVRRSIIDSIQPNLAYWLNVVQDFDYLGPLDASSNSNGLSFGKSTAMRTLVLEVPSSPSTRTVRMEAKPCAVLSSEGECDGAENTVWLEYRDSGKEGVPVWRSLADGLDVSVPAGSTRVKIELRAKRSELTATARSRNVAGGVGSFPLVIDVTDGQGSRTVIAADVIVEPIFGRWVGQASLTSVSAHPSIQSIPIEQATAPQLSMTLLLDLPDPSFGAGGPVLLDALSVEAFRDGRPVTRRFNSILLDRPVELSEDAADPLDPFGTSGTLHGTLHVQPDDPLNPYRHRYNPEHRKGYDITREITIKLEGQSDTFADELSGLDGTFGPHRLSGQYSEVITGITATPITVRGSFRLERVGAAPVSP